MPTFPVFASYAQADREKYLDKFIEEFRSSLRGLLGQPDDKGILFFDRESVYAGEKWNDKIVEAVRTSEVLVCLMSPTYLGREWCGRELEVFLRRRRRLAVESPPPFIFAIWWRLPVGPRLPARLGQIQYRDAGFPRDYEKLGVWKLGRNRLSAQFTKMADRLAEVVAETLGTPHRLPPFDAIANIEEVTNAFDDEQPYDVRMLPLTPGGDDWQPSASDVKVGAAAMNAAQRLEIFIRPVTTGPGLAGSLQQAQADQQVVLIVADATVAPDAVAHMVNSLDLPNLALLLVDAGTPAVGADIWLGLMPEGAFVKARATGLLRVAAAGTLRDDMQRLIDEARRRFQARQEGARAEDPALEARARDKGIVANLQPHLVGPGSAP